MSKSIEKNNVIHPISDYHGIFIIAEQRFSNILNVSKELIGEGKRLAHQLNTTVTAVLLGDKVDEWAKELLRFGADKVIYAEHPLLEHYVADAYCKVIADIVYTHKPEIIIFGATSIGRELAPLLSAKLHTGLTADCTKLEIDPETGLLLQTRPAFGGNLMATIQCANHRPQMCTVRPGVMKCMEMRPSCEIDGKIDKIYPSIPEQDIRTKILQFQKEIKAIVALENAPIIVAGGRGIGKAEGFQLLEQLAQKLNGCIASSRACVDNDWIPKEYQVGQTGKTVRPKLYIACGISGAIQHLAGMESSDCIVAINKDANAPIFKVADYGIVGDLYDVIPELLQSLDKVENGSEALQLCVETTHKKEPANNLTSA